MAIIHTEDEGPNELLNRRAKSSGGCVQASQAPHFHGNPDTDHKPNNLDPASTAVPGSKPNPVTTIYEGYKFFKADPIPGQKATWTRVERTQMHLSQSELYKLVQKRANKISPAQQYQGLSRTRRAHVNQLIHEQRRCEPQVEWSCVYAKERLAHRDDYGTVSMDIVLMKRPMRTKPYPRTPMGDLVDLNVPFRLDENDAYQINHERTNTAALPKLIAPRFHTVPSNFWAQEGEPGRVVQGPLPCPVPVTSPFTKLGLEQGKAAEALNRRNANSSHEK